MRGLKYVSWHERSGYGVAARRYLRGLVNAGVPVTWTPMVRGNGWGRQFFYEPFTGQSIGDAEFDRICNSDIEYDTLLVHLVPEYYPRWTELEPGKRTIGYTTWETDRLPARWPDILNRLDRVWVPSRWNKEVFERSGVKVPIDVIPHILEPLSPPAGATSRSRLERVPPDHFLFYSINVWSARKALGLLCEAFTRTFRRQEPVTLVIKTSAYDFTSRWFGKRFPLRELARTRRSFRKQFRALDASGEVILIAEEGMPQSDIDALHRRGDCYVSLSRSEGWGLGAFDAVAAGNPVVMTGYGGQRDFLPAKHAWLVDYSLVPVADPMNSDSYSPDQNWAEPNLWHAGQRMRHAFENREEAHRVGERLNEYARRHFSEGVIMDNILSILSASP